MHLQTIAKYILVIYNVMLKKLNKKIKIVMYCTLNYV